MKTAGMPKERSGADPAFFQIGTWRGHSPRMADIMVKDYVHRVPRNDLSSLTLLSPKEREVLQFLAEGSKTRDIAVTSISAPRPSIPTAADHGKARHSQHRRAHEVCHTRRPHVYLGRRRIAEFNLGYSIFYARLRSFHS
jgi:hypothetical protein